MDFAKCLGLHRDTFAKYANSNIAFEEITPYIQKKKTASNRWEAREVKLLEDKATDMLCYGQYRDMYTTGYIVHVFVLSLGRHCHFKSHNA